jgi:hypothetical protein
VNQARTFVSKNESEGGGFDEFSKFDTDLEERSSDEEVKHSKVVLVSSVDIEKKKNKISLSPEPRS